MIEKPASPEWRSSLGAGQPATHNITARHLHSEALGGLVQARWQGQSRTCGDLGSEKKMKKVLAHPENGVLGFSQRELTEDTLGRVS